MLKQTHQPLSRMKSHFGKRVVYFASFFSAKRSHSLTNDYLLMHQPFVFVTSGEISSLMGWFWDPHRNHLPYTPSGWDAFVWSMRLPTLLASIAGFTAQDSVLHYTFHTSISEVKTLWPHQVSSADLWRTKICEAALIMLDGWFLRLDANECWIGDA